ncbi:hypothetical protein KIN20_035917 [Parelaphostrongylus tenuis]|nr:hypothetical protein KIN20_011888 [Parelaphostrongylus tenuis]KAJ1354833.1 hypothetical protein KIN20_011892 [Parelaphostrongylus tenuis]KAJ1373505.1 hypothetical protein KIN20_035917 [Parelaphostrongylus tenuis]
MDRLATDFLAIQMLTIGTMLGCGVMPPGLARTVGFNVTGFTLPVSMVYTGNPTLPARFPSIHTTSGAVQAFLTRIVMQTVYDVLQQQGRVVLLPDAMISFILDQLNVRISYNPLECKAIEANPMGPFRHAMNPHCIVFRNAVTGLCLMGGGGGAMCGLSPIMNIGAIAGTHKSISGTLTTTNVIMAFWSREMWQSVVDRAMEILASGQLGLYFYTAFATVT